MTISAITLAITGVFGRAGGGVDPAASGSNPPKDEAALNKSVNKLADALKKTCWKGYLSGACYCE